jgi:predicted signal transduction protein with EAL and GGDEF domain
VAVDTSIGIATFPKDGTEADQLLKNADLALYSAKGSGRGTYRFFRSEMNARMTERRDLELELRAGFVNGEFEIFYQPLVNLQSGEVTSCEALLRWDNPKLGSVPPDIFIPVAEEIGLMTRLGEWVIRNACAEAVNWPGHVTLAVNISPVQFRSLNLVQIITHALASTGLAPKRFEIEITEALMLEHTEDTLKTLNQLRTLGVRVAMDDFGTGYSSLSYLQKFPFDKIKIDQAFIKGLSADSESSAIVRAVTGLAGSLKMVTTAEGVETEAQRALVSALGCTEMQGFLFSSALPSAEIRKILGAARSSAEPCDGWRESSVLARLARPAV